MGEVAEVRANAAQVLEHSVHYFSDASRAVGPAPAALDVGEQESEVSIHVEWRESDTS